MVPLKNGMPSLIFIWNYFNIFFHTPTTKCKRLGKGLILYYDSPNFGFVEYGSNLPSFQFSFSLIFYYIVIQMLNDYFNLEFCP